MTLTLEHEAQMSTTSASPTTPCVKVLVVVEGMNDIEFLRRISRVLHADQPSVPDLGRMERRGQGRPLGPSAPACGAVLGADRP